MLRKPITCAPDADWHEYEAETSREGSDDEDAY